MQEVMLSRPNAIRWLAGYVLLYGMAVLEAAPPKLIVPNDVSPIQLVRKPENSQGQLELTEEGVDVLMNLTAPFAMVAAVGPTRTGKSSLLGRAFLSMPEIFEIGTGVHSHTTGIWITNKPVIIPTKRYGRLSVIFVDTEGFHGVQEKTSKTYENNLFAVSYLLSSTLIYNSAYPMDSHHVDELKGYSKTATNMAKTLEASGVHINRNPPDLLWVVQNFNFYNLNNSGMSGDDLLGNLTDSTMLSTLGMADESLDNLHGMFRTKALAPIHRPHNDDKVLANLGKHDDVELKREYIRDIRRLRDKIYSSLEPMQVAGVNIDGKEFTLNIERWVLYGHIQISEDSEGMHYVDKRMEKHVEEVLADYQERIAQLQLKVEGKGILPMILFKKSLDEVQSATLTKLQSRAKFWSYTLKGSPLEANLKSTISQKGRDMQRLYTGNALKSLAKYMDGKRSEVVENLKKNLKLRASLNLATGAAVPKSSEVSLDVKGLQLAVRAVTRGAEGAVQKEAAKFDLQEDRLGKQYTDEFKRWCAALQEVLLFTHKNTKGIATTHHQECKAKELRDVGADNFKGKCGFQMAENGEQAVRDHAVEVLPSSKNETDPFFQEAVRWAVANQRTALAPLFTDSMASYKKAIEDTLGQLAAVLLDDAEAAAHLVGMVDLLSGTLEAQLERVVEYELGKFDQELRRLHLHGAKSGACYLVPKDERLPGIKAEDTSIACDEYRSNLEEKVRSAVAVVLERQRSVKGAVLIAAFLGVCFGVRVLLLKIRARRNVKLSAKI
ncbi:hypothetical protein CYMTET_7280 [Cymbomonas tetramitiformis]|uniref:Guanylate-binding protein N-terminal domain-containing protein n=1 Tax=Cymbomonas tetramitiformis TaxID=36881 RepID=A0AAE0GVA2_9CHLO|nr:hypothetical protein CYMTET_7280 [Cymbomonas tetramitiformis]